MGLAWRRGRLSWRSGHALALRGKVDRVDLFREEDRALAVVMDYKSSSRKLDKLLVEHGIQLQLLAYLAAVRRWPAEFFGAKKIIPAGVFYVNLRGQFEGGSSSRTEVLADADCGAAGWRTGIRGLGLTPRRFINWDRPPRGARPVQLSVEQRRQPRANSTQRRFLVARSLPGCWIRWRRSWGGWASGFMPAWRRWNPYRKGGATACELLRLPGGVPD